MNINVNNIFVVENYDSDNPLPSYGNDILDCDREGRQLYGGLNSIGIVEILISEFYTFLLKKRKELFSQKDVVRENQNVDTLSFYGGTVQGRPTIFRVRL